MDALVVRHWESVISAWKCRRLQAALVFVQDPWRGALGSEVMIGRYRGGGTVDFREERPLSEAQHTVPSCKETQYINLTRCRK